jgi:hypothetical protein
MVCLYQTKLNVEDRITIYMPKTFFVIECYINVLRFYGEEFGKNLYCITKNRNPIYRKEEKGETQIQGEAVM